MVLSATLRSSTERLLSRTAPGPMNSAPQNGPFIPSFLGAPSLGLPFFNLLNEFISNSITCINCHGLEMLL